MRIFGFTINFLTNAVTDSGVSARPLDASLRFLEQEARKMLP
jgi:hypothetical protein